MSTKRKITDTITLVESGGNTFICGAPCGFGGAVLEITKEAAIDLAVALLELVGWQPMSTAPRDGTEILVLFLGQYKMIAKWRDYCNNWYVDCSRTKEEDLHGWLPLPKIKEMA